MSSFKRKAGGAMVGAGTRVSGASTLSAVTSTGISSLDDILGGGLPLSCSLVVAAPDVHSSYGELMQKYFAAQGLAGGQRVCVVAAEGARWAEDLMWMPNGVAVGGDADDEGAGRGEKVRIAWRYEKMKQFQTTTVAAAGETYCAPFELSCRVPQEVLAEAIAGNRLTFVDVGQGLAGVLGALRRALGAEGAVPLRICIPGLGSPAWGDLSSQGVLHFLHALRALLRAHPQGCASTSLDARLCGGAGWLERVGWAADGALSVAAFAGDPGLAGLFPGHHGLVRALRLPAPHTLLAPSDRFSQLRGLTAGENNLAFRCTRKRLLFETLHLDVEGGPGERRTPAPAPKKEKKRVRYDF
ncbi:hypothetical protein HYPSUDRAFT_199363 [Hypholoma sublateritium FD-334 SS-4]|uniref:Elongator complex protein 4 n=1 Tax=Hypholoma sublateritium (strain FD-334 SS-4) TaxID=945553 RepID=A0A0D2LF33_HYPSF|nr:hypothetical protein HYPSUDRAFT_199363 [Hypholoma sublateritium FD-334 SS-4]